MSQSTVDSLRSCNWIFIGRSFFFINAHLIFSSLVPQDSVTMDSIDTAVFSQEPNQELSRPTPEGAYKAWFRILGSLGNINQIRSPEQHHRIMKTLFDIWKMLSRVQRN